MCSLSTIRVKIFAVHRYTDQNSSVLYQIKFWKVYILVVVFAVVDASIQIGSFDNILFDD